MSDTDRASAAPESVPDEISMFFEPTAPEEAEEKAKPEDAEDENEATSDEETAEAASEEAEEGEAEEDEDDPDILMGDGTTVPRSQLLKRLEEAEKGQLRQKDYTQKTQALAEERRRLEAELNEVSSQKDSLKGQLAEWATLYKTDPDWVSLAQQLPPQEFQVRYAAWQQQQQRVGQAAEAYRELVRSERDKLIQTEAAAVREAIPEWNDPNVAKKELAEIEQVAMDAGFSQDELRAVTDRRYILMLRQMARLKKLDVKQAETKKKVAKVATTLQPGARTTKAEKAERRAKEATSRFRKNPSDPEAFVDWLTTPDA